MTTPKGSRRRFLFSSVTGLCSAWLVSHWPAVLYAQLAPKLEFFTPDQAAEVDAVAAQIIPSDGTPGAREAHCLNFIDHFLASYGKDRQAVYFQGIQDLQAEVAKQFPGTTRFSALTSAQQTQVLTAIEKTPFFNQVRNDTITGMFADPKHLGNYNQAGWKLIGFDMSLVQKPPLGYYDRVPS